ncbi:hypothetical protein F4778DRAFT_570334 [Xylariomycetidae sp. FL2044]|nr:hypothetical protein F4778DRAFT_663755 [Xylariomycetidae sp. FL2044]KAH9884147.1 hypothetical protein F4778DRAFT_570334 [Xylariomycetidae sp. FL2044]
MARRRPGDQWRQAAVTVAQVIFAVAVFTVWILAWAVESGGIEIPQWGRSWQGADAETRSRYAATLLPLIMVIAILFIGTMVWQVRHVRCKRYEAQERVAQSTAPPEVTPF